ncbi:hypothetical protein [Rhizobium mesosinicum]|uniref:Uncharacterized protein n=1 Tax=Rhizobium mesosinicum TaxID=335017 RepID=A0ABS7GRC6_9HYPH|nr:hypothetical protein [Rhizobium mesosinicum]MBW9052459.1 hypothetical protein [Rhizobium mesosinicum]
MRETKAAFTRELLTASIWAAFGLGIFVATQPVWSHLLPNTLLSIDDQLSIRCLGSSRRGPV